jgi:hypothetical protein
VAPNFTCLARQARHVDHLGARKLVLDFGNAALDEGLLLFRGVILRVLGEVAMAARLRNRRDDVRALFGLEDFSSACRASKPPAVMGMRCMGSPMSFAVDDTESSTGRQGAAGSQVQE